MSHQSGLRTNSLYVVLFIRDDPPPEDDFHWGLYLHLHPQSGGVKYHITNAGGGGWIAEHDPVADILNSFLLVGLVRIADVPASRIYDIDGALRSFDGRLNSMDGVTCRVWLFLVLERLREVRGDRGVLKCRDLKALEREIKDWGNGFAFDASRNVQPRPVHTSTLCEI